MNAVQLRLPEGWIEVDPREPDLLDALRAKLAVPPEAEPVLVAMLTPLAVHLARLGAMGDVVLAGFYTDVVPIEDADPLVVTAQVNLAISPPVGGLDRLKEVLEGPGTTVRPIDLPAGRAVVVTGSTEVHDTAWGEAQPAHLRRYFLPVPGADRVAALSFLTPNLDLVEPFDEVFDAVAETLAFSER